MKFSGNVNGPRTRWLSSGGILTFDHLKILGQGRWALIIKHCLHQPNHSPRIYLLGYYLWSLAGRYGSPQRGHSSLEPGVRSPSTWSLHVVHCLCAFFLVLLLPPTVQRCAFGPRWMDYSKLMNLGCDCECEWAGGLSRVFPTSWSKAGGTGQHVEILESCRHKCYC